MEDRKSWGWGVACLEIEQQAPPVVVFAIVESRGSGWLVEIEATPLAVELLALQGHN